MRKPCRDCGGEKVQGSTSAYCPPCAAKRASTKRQRNRAAGQAFRQREAAKLSAQGLTVRGTPRKRSPNGTNLRKMRTEARAARPKPVKPATPRASRPAIASTGPIPERSPHLRCERCCAIIRTGYSCARCPAPSPGPSDWAPKKDGRR